MRAFENTTHPGGAVAEVGPPEAVDFDVVLDRLSRIDRRFLNDLDLVLPTGVVLGQSFRLTCRGKIWVKRDRWTHLTDSVDDGPADRRVRGEKVSLFRRDNLLDFLDRILIVADLSSQLSNCLLDLLRQTLTLHPDPDLVARDEHVSVKDGVERNVATAEVEEPRDRVQRAEQVVRRVWRGRRALVGVGEPRAQVCNLFGGGFSCRDEEEGQLLRLNTWQETHT